MSGLHLSQRYKDWLFIQGDEQESDTSGDLISREKTCDYIAEFINNPYSTQDECEMVDAMIEGIQHMSSVTPPEPKTGHWITHGERITLLTGKTATGGVICSECGYKTHNHAHVIVGCPYKYCPNCGARMAESEDV